MFKDKTSITALGHSARFSDGFLVIDGTRGFARDEISSWAVGEVGQQVTQDDFKEVEI